MKIQMLLLLLAIGLTTAVQAKTPDILTGELALNHTLAADIPDKAIRTRIGKAGLDDLYNRFEQHYGEFVRADNPRKVDFDFIFGAKNAKTSMELNYLIGLAMQERLPLERFAKFGIQTLAAGSYSYDLKLSPHLALPNQLFTTLSTDSDIRVHKKSLSKKGFRQEDFLILEKYLKQNSYETLANETTLAYMTYLHEKIDFFTNTVKSKQVLSSKYYQHSMGKLSYVQHHIRFQCTRNWALKLLSKLDLQRQRILKSHLVGRFSNQISIETTESTNDFESLEKIIISGQFGRDIRTYINQKNHFEEL